MFRKYFLIISAAVLLAAIFWGDFFVVARQELLGAFFSGIRTARTHDSEQELINLRSENIFLKNKLDSLKADAGAIPEGLAVKIYSAYPFNTRNAFVTSGGATQGVLQDMAATIDGKTMVGFVESVSGRTSLVRTIFDASFQIPVRIGPHEIDALLQGGNRPLLTLIEKNADVNRGDAVISADKRFPYGLIIGAVGEISGDSTEAFKETAVDVPYVVTKLRTLYLVK
ncbi:MAG: rod shape-determining protein MreC [Parcubacteria group bacterium]|nr:rod shape-determining protein MreC [Parcubacteria group bacterium]